MNSGVHWITCLFPDLLDLFPGTKVHRSQCLACVVSFCPNKQQLFQTFFPEMLELEKTTLSRKIMELNRKLKRQGRSSSLYCPRKGALKNKCLGLQSFCRYNLVCERFDVREGRSFIQSIRWRKVMIYVVKFLDGTVKTVDRADFGGVNINDVEIVYPGNLEVEVVVELVPQGEETERLQETIATFKEKYAGTIVSAKGLVDFGEWFSVAKPGDRAVIPERALVPTKSYRVVRIRGDYKPRRDELETDRTDETNQPLPLFDLPAAEPVEVEIPAPAEPEIPVHKKTKTAKHTETLVQSALFPEPETIEEEVPAKKKGRGRKKDAE